MVVRGQDEAVACVGHGDTEDGICRGVVVVVRGQEEAVACVGHGDTEDGICRLRG